MIGIEEDHLTLLQSTKPDAFLSPTSPIDIAMAGRNAMETEIARAFPDTEYRDTLVWFQSARNTDGATILLRHGSLSVATSCH